MNESVSFTRSSYKFEQHNPHLTARNPGPADYTHKLKNTKIGYKIPRSNRPKNKNRNPAPTDYNININSIRRKTPSAQIVMDQVDRMVKFMNESKVMQSKMISDSNQQSVFENSNERTSKPTALRLGEQKSSLSGTTRASEGKHWFFSR
jgi:hypothetical protein